MNELLNFQQFLTSTGSSIPLANFVFNLICTAVFSYLTGILYSEYGFSLSSRQSFSRNFVLIGMTTMLIMSVVKSSLALSLGLVGALSIVRFRAAIKEPEELAYIFLLISLGLGFGADQGKIVTVAFIIIALIVILTKKYSLKMDDNKNLIFNISIKPSKNINLGQLIEILKNHCTMVSIRRFDESKDIFDASFSVNILDIYSLSKLKDDLLALDDSVNINFLDNKDIF